MSGKPLSGELRRWLLNELESWQNQGLISEDQQLAILKQYETGADVDARQGNRSIAVLMSLAAFMIGLAVLLLIGFNWEARPDFVKLALIIGSLWGSHALGDRLQRQNAGIGKVHAAHFLGCFLYGCGIWLVAQIFHLSAHYPNGCWLWAVGIFPFAMLLNSFAIHLLMVTVLAIWCGQEVLGFPNLGGWLFGRWSWLPNAAWTLPLFAIPGLVQV